MNCSTDPRPRSTSRSVSIPKEILGVGFWRRSGERRGFWLHLNLPVKRGLVVRVIWWNSAVFVFRPRKLEGVDRVIGRCAR